jgi:hypothetical protein
MDAFGPAEFLFHLLPLLHVAGLEDASLLAGDAEAFGALVASLRRCFAAKKGVQPWDAARGASTDFHAVLVEKVRRRLSSRSNTEELRRVW